MASNSLWWRALIAMSLMVGFYAFSIAIAGVLLAIPWLEWQQAHRVHLQLAFFCIGGAGIILWSILPRPDRFVAPGPRLRPEEHPLLFEQLRDIAERVRQSMPQEVYLVPDMNAWVAERGGSMGVGSRRVMGLGLPLLEVLTVAQLRAVLVHEYGHFHGGDTRLGPWVYKTRSAIIRTVSGLDQHSGILRAIFSGYAWVFLRVSHAVSRGQEFAADRLAAATVGAAPLIEGLKTIHRLAPAQQAYWSQEVTPVLDAGFLPDLSTGFRRFLEAGGVREALQRQEESGESEKPDPYDTHPPLRARIDALSGFDAGSPASGDDRPAVSLLAPDYDAATRLIEALAPPGYMDSVQQIGWEEVGAKVLVPQWRQLARQFAPRLRDLSFGELPEKLEDPEGLAERFVEATASQLTEEQGLMIVGPVIGVATVVALLDRGGVLEAGLGEQEVVEIEGIRLRPFTLAHELASGAIGRDEWAGICARLEIGEVSLGGFQKKRK